MRTLGVVTIGQSPRDDVVPHLARHLPPGTRIMERGVLDGMTRDEIAGLGPVAGDYVLVTRLRDGGQVVLGRSAIEPLVSRLVAEAVRETGLVLLLCTGDLSTAHFGRVVLPATLTGMAARLWVEAGFTRLGVITPSEDQIPQTEAKWMESLGTRVESLRVASASPYRWEKELVPAARSLAGADLVVMDCMGFSPPMKAEVTGTLEVPVLLPVTLVGRMLGELLDTGDAGTGARSRTP